MQKINSGGCSAQNSQHSIEAIVNEAVWQLKMKIGYLLLRFQMKRVSENYSKIFWSMRLQLKACHKLVSGSFFSKGKTS